MTERVAHLEALERQALHDFLTGLPNRMLLRDRLEQAIRTAGRENAPLALFVMDVDRFKEINDTFGHQFGDLLLKEFGQRLRGVLRTADTVARLGGDEFAVLLPAAGSAAGAAVMAEKILTALERPFMIEGQSLEVSASIGIALCPQDGDDWTTLLRCADVAMYAAKQSSEGYVVYSASNDTFGESGVTLMRELRGRPRRQAAGAGLPAPGRACGTAASARSRRLVRWRHPRRGILLPGQFLPAAERTGTIKSVCEWALQRALEDCRGWNDAGFPLHVAVNVSGRNLRDPLLIEKISQMLGSSGLEPASLKLEIEEGSVISDPHGAIVAMHRIQAAGVQLAIDDFGASGALLTSLKRLPVDEIKLAGAFVRDMVRDARDAAIVRCTIDLGHSLGRRVVAQDVADAAAWQMLAEFGCDDAQGPYAGPTHGAVGSDALARAAVAGEALSLLGERDELVAASDGSLRRGHDVEPAGSLVEKLQDRLQVRGRGVLVADRELGELDAGQRDADGREREDRAGRRPQPDARAELRQTQGCVRLDQDVLARAAVHHVRPEPLAHPRVVAGQPEGHGVAVAVPRLGMRGVVDVEDPRARRVDADGALGSQQELVDLHDRRGAVDAIRPLAGLQRRGLDLEPDDFPERGHTRVIFFRMSPSHAYFRRLRPRAAFFCSALP